MKKVMISLFALLIAAQAQGVREPLAVLVVGVDSWMLGDVIAHIVGEELKRSNPNLVPVTREKFVQNKLKALRRASGNVNLCEVRDWAKTQGLSQVCLVEAKNSFTHTSQAYSAHRIDLTDAAVHTTACSANFTFEHPGGEMSPAELTKVAWEVAGRMQSVSCKPSYVKCYDWEPTMVFVEGGTFEMGCKSPRDTYHPTCSDCYTCNNNTGTPTVTVQVSVSDFWIGKYEVTQAEWREVMKNRTSEPLANPSTSKPNCDLCPVNYVSWNDVQIFLDTLNKRTGRNYRLPTEGQWEYAARGGNITPKKCTTPDNGCMFSGSNNLRDAVYSGIHEVGDMLSKSPYKLKGNELGIYTMSENVSEWCADNWQNSLPVVPTGSSSYNWDKPYNCSGACAGNLSNRVRRGGNFTSSDDIGIYARNAVRRNTAPDYRFNGYGFRVVLP
jgi:formylglycine-generating enzyme required for sulfatase activity